MENNVKANTKPAPQNETLFERVGLEDYYKILFMGFVLGFLFSSYVCVVIKSL